ncbi:MOSC domain-containing protein [Zobellia barbeyronii]|uniref:MOSC domain-containing protein n=1 Tax=Zobellia barbeyronii TaxID=2748009 RepID=A0ABS5WFN8_9FLAO|nr:MOSC domain-containing protein [Zobellia barbeyronii]MBT2161771.1 MOSC domain-containing protein [Zobellia barbeyronii]
MKIISTNIGSPTTITWNGKEEQTGIFKYPVDESLFLGKTDVAKDTVIDRKHHAGINKACFLFSVDHYDYWKNKYPNLDWNWGMFGENLTVSDFDESKIRIGDIYKLGSVLVQVSQPREPCYKLGIRFEDQGILKEYIDYGFPGTYVRILEEGEVKKGDELVLVEQSENRLTVKDFYQLLFMRKKDPSILQLALTNESLPEYKRERLKKYLPKI